MPGEKDPACCFGAPGPQTNTQLGAYIAAFPSLCHSAFHRHCCVLVTFTDVKVA